MSPVAQGFLPCGTVREVRGKGGIGQAASASEKGSWADVSPAPIPSQSPFQ